MVSTTYQLTTDEQERARAKAIAESRVVRLLQVRAADKRLARSRTSSYRAAVQDSAALLRQELVAILERQRALELGALQAQYAAALAGIAAAHRDAPAASEREEQARVARAAAHTRSQAAANARFAAAIAQVRSAKQAELSAVLAVLAHRRDTMAAERGLAREAAVAAREAAAAHALAQDELLTAEDERRRRNLCSKVDFRYSRLHELGVAHLVVRGGDAGGVAQEDPGAVAQDTMDRLV